jgi:hypothetical protein
MREERSVAMSCPDADGQRAACTLRRPSVWIIGFYAIVCGCLLLVLTFRVWKLAGKLV